MRISTAYSYDNGINTLLQRQDGMSALQNQMTTGKRVNKASDDPAAAARAERALASVSRGEADQRTIDASRSVMTQTESALGDAGGLLQNARALLVEAGNPTLNDADRKALAAQLQSLRGQLLGIANQDNGAGTYVFGGQGSTQQPFVDTPSGVKFTTTSGALRTEAGTDLPLTSDGNAAWMTARTGNGVFVTSAGPGVAGATIDTGSVTDPSALTGAAYTLAFTVTAGVTTYAVMKNGAATAVTAAPYVSGQAIAVDGMALTVSGTPVSGNQFQVAASTATLSVFDSIDKAIGDLSAIGRTGPQMAQANGENIRNLDSVMANLQAARGAAGDVLNDIDSQKGRLDARKLVGTTDRSNAEDVDMVHAISEFQSRQNGYDAALKSYALVQHLSLFQYVNG
ncbi:MAG: flagellar hook-associated protein FlgL [Pseudomonadota bacterium]|nr:flagellar hook-associated protein FlgL [Pseudomonadota bacterium]